MPPQAPLFQPQSAGRPSRRRRLARSRCRAAHSAAVLSLALALAPSGLVPRAHAGGSGEPDEVRLVDEATRGIALADIDGNPVAPLAPEAGSFSILVFTATECPIANAFSPEIARIASEYGEKQCTLFLVYTDPELDAAEIRRHLEDYSLKGAIALLDKEQLLVRATGVTHTPEASVIDHDGNQLYRGRINNRYAALGKARRVITRHDLRQALEAIVKGDAVPVARTEVIGCYLPTLPDPPAGN